MDRKQGFSDHGYGQAGIELWPTTTTQGGRRHSQPGMEAVDYSNLEVVAPRSGLSQARTWEKASNLPQVAPHGGGSETETTAAYSAWGVPPPKDGNGIFRADTICGVKRQMFWIIIAIGIFVMVAAVAVGVGLGVALQKDDKSQPSATPLPSANSTRSPAVLPPPTATGTTGPDVAIRCPANNLTLYGAAGTNKSYLLLCGRDYSSLDGAVDLFSEPLDTMSDCIDECAKQQGCIGVGYGPYNNKNTCWLKSKLGDPNVTPNWYFAVEDSNATRPT